MKLTPDQTGKLIEVIGVTRDREINCNECLDHVGEYAERELQGKPIAEALEAVGHHLTICLECREEYESLLSALKALPETSDGES